MKVAVLLLLAAAVFAAEGRWVTVVATGYSPWDHIDSHYRATKGKDLYRTALYRDVREQPFGVAMPLAYLGKAVYIPPGHGYESGVYEADDSGSMVRRRTRRTGVLHIDLRFKTEEEGLRFGVRVFRVFIFNKKYEALPDIVQVPR